MLAADAADQGLGALAGASGTAAVAVYGFKLVWAAYQRSLDKIEQIHQEKDLIQQARLDDAKEQAAMLTTATALLERNTRMLERQVSSSNQAGGG